MVDRWAAVLNEILAVFENELVQTADSGVFNIIAHIHEAMGDIEAAQAVFKNVQPYYEELLKQKPNDRTALSSLVYIYEKLGNTDLAHRISREGKPNSCLGRESVTQFLSRC